MDKPDLYSKVNSITRNASTRYLNEYSSKFKWNKSGGSVIDLGCGDGSVTATILKKHIPGSYEKFYACEINQTMLDYAKKHYGHENIIFLQQNIQDEIPNDLKSAFDNAFSIFLFHWISDQEKAFQNVYDLLKPEGECFHMFFGHLCMYDPYIILSRTPKWSDWLKLDGFVSPYHNMPDPEKKIKQLLKDIGFIDISVECKDMSHSCKNALDYKKLLRAVDPHKMPDAVFDDFYTDYFKVGQEIGAIDKENSIQGDRELKFDYKLLIVHACKPQDRE